MLLLLMGTPVFAGYNGAVRSSPFAVCRAHASNQITRPFPASCEPRVSELARRREDAAAIDRVQQLAAANNLARKRIDEQLDLFIDSRAKLLVCMNTDTEECRTRVNALTTMLTTQAKRLRILLALSTPPPYGNDEQNIDVIPHEIGLPGGLGGRRLPSLSAQEQIEVRETRAKMLASLQYPDGDVTPDCRPKPTANDPCRRYQTWLFNQKTGLREAAGNVAEVLAHQLPLVTQVDVVPVTKEAARKILRDSQDVLRAWKSEVARDHVDRPEALVHNYPRLFEPILREHPEYCDGVSAALVRARAKGELKDVGMMAAQAGTSIASCWFVGGALCTAVGTGWSFWHLKDKAWKAGVLRERYESLGSVEGAGEDETSASMLPYPEVKSAQRDAVIALASATVSSGVLMRSAAKALDPDRLPARPWSQQLDAAMNPEKLDSGTTEKIIMKAGRRMEKAVQRNATEAISDRRLKIDGLNKPVGLLEEELAELYSPAP